MVHALRSTLGITLNSFQTSFALRSRLLRRKPCAVSVGDLTPMSMLKIMSAVYDSVRNCPFCVERDLKYLHQSQADKNTFVTDKNTIAVQWQ